MYYLIYVKADCRFCDDVLKLLHEHKKEYVLVECTDDEKQLHEVQKEHKWQTVPMIFECKTKKRRTFIGGYTDMKKYMENKS